MIYNIALTFEKEINNQIYDFYKNIEPNLSLTYGLKKISIPHITLIKFESKIKLTKDELYRIVYDLEENINIDFSGITILPSNSKGCWLELQILKNYQLANLQNNLMTKLSNFKIMSGVGDKFRPHITFAKIKDSRVNFNRFDYSILRKKEVKAIISIGTADSTFEFYNL